MSKTVLMVDFFRTEDEQRRSEFLACLLRNSQCELIDEIIVFVQLQELKYFQADLQGLPFSKIQQRKKIKINPQRPGYRSTYADMFIYYNSFLKGNTCIIANNDIYFNDTLKHIEDMGEKDFLCLSRINESEDGTIDDRDINPMSQDVWIFKSVIPTDMSVLHVSRNCWL